VLWNESAHKAAGTALASIVAGLDIFLTMIQTLPIQPYRKCRRLKPGNGDLRNCLELAGKFDSVTGSGLLTKMKSIIYMLMSMGLIYGLLVSPGMADAPVIGLIVKTDTNPFFVKMKEAARQKAVEFGIELHTFAGRYDGDTKTQIEAIRHLVAAGAQGILLTPSDPAVLANTVLDAREAGVLVIALDTPFDPADTADATFATDNFRAGELIGMWAKARMGASVSSASIVTLDGSEAQTTVDVLRNQGFLKGFGIDLADPRKMYDEDDVRIIGHGTTHGTEAGGRSAMETLIRQKPGMDVVYAINEPAGAGAHAALRALGMKKEVLLVSIDGGCPGVRRVAAGALGATAMQYPLRMISLGIEAVVEFAKTGKKPENTPGLDFHDTGVTLVTDKPVAGIPSISSKQGLKACWGNADPSHR